MTAVTAGELWILRIDREFRRVKVIGPAGKPGWWRCVDLATDISILAREDSFARRQGTRLAYPERDGSNWDARAKLGPR